MSDSDQYPSVEGIEFSNGKVLAALIVNISLDRRYQETVTLELFYDGLSVGLIQVICHALRPYAHQLQLVTSVGCSQCDYLGLRLSPEITVWSNVTFTPT